MSIRTLIASAAVVAAALAMIRPAAAQVADVDTATVPTEAPAPTTTWRFTLGVGAALAPDYVGSNDYTAAALPKARAQKGPYYADLTGSYITSNVLPSKTWQFGPAGQYIKGDRCNSGDRVVNNMKCQSDSFMLGGMVGYNFRLSDTAVLTPRARMLFDVTGASDGFTFEPQLNYAKKLSEDWGLLLQGNLIVGSDDFEDYYFGVNNRQARESGLRQRTAHGGAQQLGFTVVGRYSITQNWGLDLVGRYQRLVGDAANSPLVEGTSDSRGSANQFIFGVLGTYTF